MGRAIVLVLVGVVIWNCFAWRGGAGDRGLIVDAKNSSGKVAGQVEGKVGEKVAAPVGGGRPKKLSLADALKALADALGGRGR